MCNCCLLLCVRYVTACYRCRKQGELVELKNIESELQTGDVVLYSAYSFIMPSVAQCTPW